MTGERGHSKIPTQFSIACLSKFMVVSDDYIILNTKLITKTLISILFVQNNIKKKNTLRGPSHDKL